MPRPQLSGDSKEARTARLLYRVYREPSVLAEVCEPYLAADAVAIMLWGLFFRVLTHVLLFRKAARQVKYR